jgi:hypothetical protein
MRIKVKEERQRGSEATRQQGSGVSARSGLEKYGSVAKMPRGFFVVLLAVISGRITSSTSAFEVRGVQWDGTPIAGQWVASPDGKRIDIQTADGVVGIAVDDLSHLDFLTDYRAPFGPVAFYLHDGGVMFGVLLAGQADAIQARTAVGDLKIDWNKLAALRLGEPTQFKRANELFQEALRTRSPSQDMLVSRDPSDVKVLQGRLETLDESGGSFLFAGESRKFQNEKLYGIVFAAGAAKPAPGQVLIELADGSSFSAALKSANEKTVRAESSFGAAVEISVSHLRRLKFRSDRVEFVSDLKPTTQRIEGVLHAPWAVQPDRNVLGNSLSIGGRKFERGLGVHSRTELSYAIGGEFDRFAATIGIDDAVRPLGSVVMQVLGDGRTLFDSGLVAGDQPPRDILVEVAGVESLTLVVDYGDGLDASDHADWGDARLLRAGTKSKRN